MSKGYGIYRGFPIDGEYCWTGSDPSLFTAIDVAIRDAGKLAYAVKVIDEETRLVVAWFTRDGCGRVIDLMQTTPNDLERERQELIAAAASMRQLADSMLDAFTLNVKSSAG